MSIEGIELNRFGDPKHTLPLSTTQSCTHHAVFHSFFVMTEKRMLPPQLQIEKNH